VDVVGAVVLEEAGDPRAASAAADDTELDFGLGLLGRGGKGDGHCRSGCCGGGDELPAGGGEGVLM